MQIVMIGIRLFFWMIILPYCCGIPLASRFGADGRTLEMTVVSGYLLMVSVFQVYYLFFILFYNHFIPLVWLSALTYIIIGGLAVVLKGKFHLGGRKAGRHKKEPVEIVLWGVFAVLIMIQLYMTVFYYYPDGDDAFYAVTSVITTTNDNMYVNIPYTGETSILDKRHAFSSAPIFISFLGKVCGVHPVIMSNVFFSVVVIILVYMIYKIIATVLLEEQKKYIPLFLIFISILYLFGNSTIYQDTTFLLTRTGQGKAFLANVIPAVIILGLLYADKSEKTGDLQKSQASWGLLSFSMLAAGYTSSMGMFLGPLLTGVGAAMLAIRHRNPGILLKFAISVIPLALVGILYILLIYLA